MLSVKTARSFVMATACVGVAAGCHGGSSPAGTSVSDANSDSPGIGADEGAEGTPSKKASVFTIVDGVARVTRAKGSSIAQVPTNLLLTGYASACMSEEANAAVSSRAYYLALANVDSGTHMGSAATAAGTYRIVRESKETVGGGLFAEGWSDSSCLDAPGGKFRAVSGRVVVTRVDATSLEGTFDLTFEDGGNAVGPFRVKMCDAFNPNRTLACSK
jgi:hypothetical protein